MQILSLPASATGRPKKHAGVRSVRFRQTAVSGDPASLHVRTHKSRMDEEQRMCKNIIHIFGASGSGTTTLGRKICSELGYYFMDTDDYFWLPTNPKYTTKRDKKERLLLMHRDIQRAENVVIAGSLVDWGDELIPLFTLAIRLETATDIRICRLKEREREKFGKRIEFGGDMFEIHQEFIAWAKSYDNGGINMRSKAKHDAWQKLL